MVADRWQHPEMMASVPRANLNRHRHVCLRAMTPDDHRLLIKRKLIPPLVPHLSHLLQEVTGKCRPQAQGENLIACHINSFTTAQDFLRFHEASQFVHRFNQRGTGLTPHL